ncbi:hypothetical protein [Dipodfec virus RodF1_38]|uniref:Uncharacterized protein n=1 Tax=Dipodfec virus RodF1_38 TaxID=2929296 RepID=A0A976N321_9VIRU|nr:hypothetical protein [Dipodfec virus RodF1_38]
MTKIAENPMLTVKAVHTNTLIDNPTHQASIPVHYPRGACLLGVLSGDIKCEYVKGFSDIPEDNSDIDIEYDPRSDTRLDKFDGVEFGFDLMDGSVNPGNPKRRESKSEEKE